MRRIGAILALSAVMLAVTAGTAHAKLGIVIGPSFGVKNPLTPHVGRVYYKPGDKASRRAVQDAEQAPDELVRMVKEGQNEAYQLKCDKLHMQYLMRHGLTTPMPLKGFTGCGKWSRDEAYWQTRRGERHTISSPKNQALYAAHDAVFNW